MHDKAFNIAKDPKYDGYQWGRSLMIYNFFDKGTSSKTVKTENILNKELAEELYKPIIRKFEKRKIYSPFICNIWGAGFPDMQLVSKPNKGTRLFLCVIDIFSKYAWVIRLKDKKGITITNAFQTIVDEFNCKPSKMWEEKGSEFYNKSMKYFLQNDDTETYLTHNEGKSVLDERFIRNLKNKVYKYITSISKNIYLDNLDDIYSKYNNTHHNN